MKKCSTCFKEKDLSEFPPRKRGTRKTFISMCRPCYKTYQRDYYRKRVSIDSEYRERKQKWRKARQDHLTMENRIRLWEYHKSHPCVTCGESDPVVLEFNHLDPTEKEYTISEIIRRPWESILKEISKCEVLCANCHRRKTAKQFNWYRGIV